MATSGMQISALHLAIAASGGVLLYAALQGISPLEALKEVTSGKTPRAVEAKSSSLTQSSSAGVGGGVVQAGLSGGGGSLVSAAQKYLGVPYVWAGTTSSGLDCSGLIVVAFRDAYGVTPPRTTYLQEVWGQLKKVGRGDLSPGDLVFWPGHVAIYVGSGKVIHSPRPGRSVSYAPLDDAGPRGVRISSYQRYKNAEPITVVPPSSDGQVMT
ncbi:C40 family peptidase [Streptomyces sp. NPDC006208]|uniref:C40 family peptidase n=1 Tax=Streptomyces sp. NPDC006208 TaxID=3156734 RepID=UPI0033A8CF6E